MRPLQRINPVLFICLASLALSPIFASAIRSIQESKNQVVVIHTALGYSTLLEFPEKPSSVVLGDQDAFQVEYLGSTITLKPLIANAASNLFVFTPDQHYNCTLVSGSKAQVDYVVRFRPDPVPQAKNTPERRPILLNRSSHFGGIRLTALSILLPSDHADPRDATIVQFELKSSSTPYAFTPASLEVRQSGKPITAQGLYLERTTLDPSGAPVPGTLVVLNQDRSGNAPLELDFEVELPSRSNRHTKLKAKHRISVSLALPRLKKGVPHGPFQANENQDRLLFPGGTDPVLKKTGVEGQEHQTGRGRALPSFVPHSSGGGK